MTNEQAAAIHEANTLHIHRLNEEIATLKQKLREANERIEDLKEKAELKRLYP